jgi:hypothetical protein
MPLLYTSNEFMTGILPAIRSAHIPEEDVLSPFNYLVQPKPNLLHFVGKRVVQIFVLY